MVARSVFVVCLLLMSIAHAQNMSMQDIIVEQFGQQNHQLSQKYRMTEYLLNSPWYTRMHMSENTLARGLLEKADISYQLAVKKAKADDRDWLEANAVTNSVLRDLKTSASLLNKKPLDHSMYDGTLKRVKAFTYQNWSNLTGFGQEILNDTDEQSTRLAKHYITKSIRKTDSAPQIKNDSENRQASYMLEDSIKDLLATLKILGIRI